VECWGAGAAGQPATAAGAGLGGGGGEYACEPAYQVVPGQPYAFTCPQPGNGLTIFDGNQWLIGGGGVVAHPAAGPGWGSGSNNSISFHGGSGGAAGTATPVAIGGGGGSSGGHTAPGNTGTAGNSGGQGAAPPDGGFGGGAGDPVPRYGGGRGLGPGAGGGGGGLIVTSSGQGGSIGVSPGGPGKGGRISLTYDVTITSSSTVTQVLPMVPIKVTATWNSVTYPLFYGYANAWTDAALNNPRYAETTLTATDAFGIFALNSLPAAAPVGAGDDSGSRADRILDWAGWPPQHRLLDIGDSTLQATAMGDYVLNLLQLTADSEIGEVYVNGSGQVVFRHRQGILADTRSTTPQAVFGDRPGTAHTAGTEWPYTSVTRADDSTTMANDVQITAAGSGNLQEAQDYVSQFVYGGGDGGGCAVTYARTDLLLQSDVDALAYAGWVLYISASDEDRMDQLIVSPMRDPSDLYPQVLGREIGDRIQIWRRPPNVAAPVSKDCFIRGIEHDFDASGHAWTTTWTLQSAAKYGSFLTLNSATAGLLDSNALAY